MPTDSINSTADWLQPSSEQHGLSRYLQTIRERWWIVALVTLLGIAGMSIYAFTADEQYEARADLLVAPVPADNAILSSVGLFTESTDPALDVETAAQVIDSTEVAGRTSRQLGGDPSSSDVLEQTSIEPIPDSNVVAVTASATDPQEAQAVANGFAAAAVAEQTDEVHRRVEEVLPRLRDQLTAALEGGAAAETLADQVSQLEILLNTDNPTLRVETPATTPTSAVSPRRALLIGGGLIGGLALGLTIAVAFQVLDPRLRREEQLRDMFRLPILARIPRQGAHTDRPLSPDSLSPAAREAYRTLRGTLAATEREGGGRRVVLVTGSGPSEGKTTTAINLAASLALAGQRTILVESDLRRPAIGRTLGIKAPMGVVSVLIELSDLDNALVSSQVFGPDLQFLLADETGASVSDLFSLPAAQRLLASAREAADYVIVDAPPLVDVVDALPLARMADAVLLVAHLGKSRLSRMKELGELLASNGVRPVGVALIGVVRSGAGRYYYEHAGDRRAPLERRPRGAVTRSVKS